MKRSNFNQTFELLKKMEFDNELLNHLEQMSPIEKEKFMRMFYESINDEVISHFAICNRNLFVEYLKKTPTVRNFPQAAVLSI